AVALATEIGIIDLHEPMELTGFLPFGHGLHDLVLELPGGVVTHPEMALERQRRQVRLAGSQKMHRQEPLRQRQLAAGEHCAAGEGRLMPARPALVVDPARTPELRPRPATTGRTAKPL